MKISKEDRLEMRALTAEIVNAQASMQAAQRQFEDAKMAEKNRREQFNALHVKLGLDPSVHTIFTEDVAQPDGSVITAGEVFVTKTGKSYEPPVENRATRRAAMKK